jgi:hypothetical protein
LSGIENYKEKSFGMLTVNQSSYLDERRDEFDIALEGSHPGPWYPSDKQNTIELRSARLKKPEENKVELYRDYTVTRQTRG